MTHLVNVDRFKFIPPVVPNLHDSGASIPPPSDPSRATASPALSSYQFVEFNSHAVRRTSQKRPSDTPTSGPVPQASNSSRQGVRRSGTTQTSISEPVSP
ncbi:hypothetical protein C8R48DRAFT_780482 [Suillus tomentosus]|nr:hypothetical protein C8R48DRAFT_780482 [Suillus tomentosus]